MPLTDEQIAEGEALEDRLSPLYVKGDQRERAADREAFHRWLQENAAAMWASLRALRDDRHVLLAEFDRVAAERDAAIARADGMQKDAERYRARYREIMPWPEFDASIDAAIEARRVVTEPLTSEKGLAA